LNFPLSKDKENNKREELAANRKSQRGVVYVKKFVFENNPDAAKNKNKLNN
jgi:hypothetical protein